MFFVCYIVKYLVSSLAKEKKKKHQANPYWSTPQPEIAS